MRISIGIAGIGATAWACPSGDFDRYGRWSVFSATVWSHWLVPLFSAILHRLYRRRQRWLCLSLYERYRWAASLAFRLQASRNWSNNAESSVRCFSAFARARSSLRRWLSNRSISWCLTLRVYWMERRAPSHVRDWTTITLLAERISPDSSADSPEDPSDFYADLCPWTFEHLEEQWADVTLKMCNDPRSMSIG